jgi:cation-transporting ATPase 13A1
MLRKRWISFGGQLLFWMSGKGTVSILGFSLQLCVGLKRHSRRWAGLCWKTIDDSVEVPLPKALLQSEAIPDGLKTTLLKHDLCITGPALARVEGTPLYEKYLLSRIWVYARTSPSQKEYILTSLKQAGYTTLMCGDGTNDVGALKQAHVGVALLDGTPEDLQKIAIKMRERRLKDMKAKQEEMYKAWGIKPPSAANGSAPASTENAAVPALSPLEQKKQDRLKKQQESVSKLMEKLETVEDDIPVLKFGDASVAAPFTSKLSSIMSSE